jgi:hypothetical protein
MTRGLGARNLDLDLLAAPCACSISYRRGWLRNDGSVHLFLHSHTSLHPERFSIAF